MMVLIITLFAQDSSNFRVGAESLQLSLFFEISARSDFYSAKKTV